MTRPTIVIAALKTDRFADMLLAHVLVEIQQL